MPAALEKCSIKFEFDNSEIRLVLASFFFTLSVYPFACVILITGS